ncbi:MAG: DUF3168 domain-containing protein [Hyphomonadaceae bacterium]|nr:DUF3168 domain-containing protein [Hyphomonadaceae bacterium]
MKAEFRNYLLSVSGLTALVGTRIRWDALPQGGSLPAIALHMISAPRDYTLRSRVGLTGFIVQMDVWSATLPAREAIVTALIAALDGLPGGDSPALIRGAFIDNQRDTFELGQGPDATGAADFYRSSLDVRVWFPEA